MHKIIYVFFYTYCTINFSFASNINYSQLIEETYNMFKNESQGKNASYIPALTKYNPKNFGIAIVTVDGNIYSNKDAKIKFPIESISKIFTLALVMEKFGSKTIEESIGVNATGLPFNSVLAIELVKNHISNPLVNSGAIATVSLIKGGNYEDKWNQILDNMNTYANIKLTVNEDVYTSEMATNQHNQAIAKLLQSYDRLYNDPDKTVDLYTKQCSIEVSALDLAVMGSVFANNGISVFNKKNIISKENTKKILSLMTINGIYDNSGLWMYKVGLPAKSGVSGGILAIYPNKFAIAVYSPPVDEKGNSVRAQKAIEYIANKINSNIFN